MGVAERGPFAEPLRWLGGSLGFAYAAFIGLATVVVAGEVYSLSRPSVMLAFFALPTVPALLVLTAAWHHARLGSALYGVLALVHPMLVGGRADAWGLLLLFAAPALIGTLFLVASLLQRGVAPAEAAGAGNLSRAGVGRNPTAGRAGSTRRKRLRRASRA
jgi:hypothetical protein